MAALTLPDPPDPGNNQPLDQWRSMLTNYLRDMADRVSRFCSTTNLTYVLTNNGAMTGVPTAPTAAAGTNTTQIATTAFVSAASGSSLVSPAFTGTPTAPTAAALTSTTQLATTAFATAAVAAQAVLVPDVGRNYFHNSMFRVQQRGAGAFTTVSAYNADRWVTSATNGTRSVTIVTLADADRTAVADEAAKYGLQYVFAGGASAGDYEVLCQKIEDTRRTAGKTMTVSFWAKASSGTPQIGLNYLQTFGTGGSPSSSVTGTAQAVTTSTTWTKFTATFVIPAATGKTFGSTVNTDYLQFNFWLSSGATNNTAAGSIGVQSATISFWGMQLEVASVATQLEKSDYRYDLANCQRFYYTGRIDMQDGAYVLGVTTFGKCDFPVTMRLQPTVTASAGGANTNVTGATVGVLSAQGAFCTGTATAAGNWSISQFFTATADL